jgi:adenosylcobyric acid synthase
MLVAGLCRLLARKGIKVAPFKAQNMSNNSAVTVEGGEIGRAQAMQARAAGLAPSVRFNPILLKPGSDRTSQLVVRGHVAGAVGAVDYIEHRDRLAELVANELAALRSEFDAVICEGAGSPAEINLRATDLANMGLARAAHLPASWSATSTVAGCLPTCSARWRCSRRKTRHSLRALWSTSSAVTRHCSRRG